tara:strand:- start:653 stop:1690 length:1038 start_codon:yes stop_codon:yes gene_type:complete
MVKFKNLVILLNIFIVFIVIELFINFILDFRVIIDANTCKRIYNKEFDYSYYSPNCENVIKHWEQDNFVSYKINSEGRRDITYQNKNTKKLAFIGDSFTFGAMVPIEDNYNFYAFNNILKSSYEIHNYGTPAEQLHNVINKLKTLEEKEYEYFVYGITPNDFFDLVDGSYIKKHRKLNVGENENETKITNIMIFKKIKSYLLSTATSRFILHNLMSNDTIYIKTYLSRKPYSGYLLENLPIEWTNAIDYFDEALNKLDIKYKSKLKIFILPQRAEVVSNRLNIYNSSFVNLILKICTKNKIDCSSPNLKSLSKVINSHFPVDGHLTVKGNHDVAKYLSKWAQNWN